MQFIVDDKDRDKVVNELSEAQSRIIQVFVPTLVAVGLISIADNKDKFALITMFTSFAILFGASLYIANLSYKIFRNATFLKAVADRQTDKDSNIIYWEKALSLYVAKREQPKIIAYETKTIALIFIVFSITYTLMFFKVNTLLSIILGFILILVAIKIFLIPSKSNESYETWKKVLNEYSNE